VDRPTRIVAIPGERLPRCCEYGAFPARSARPPSLLGGCGQGDTASDRRVLGLGGCVGQGSPGPRGAARIADASPAAYATTTRAGPGGLQCRLVRRRRSTGARRGAAAPTTGLAGSAGARGLPLTPAPPAVSGSGQVLGMPTALTVSSPSAGPVPGEGTPGLPGAQPRRRSVGGTVGVNHARRQAAPRRPSRSPRRASARCGSWPTQCKPV
jgi:hypothetical protein